MGLISRHERRTAKNEHKSEHATTPQVSASHLFCLAATTRTLALKGVLQLNAVRSQSKHKNKPRQFAVLTEFCVSR